MIELRDITLVRGGFKVLDGVSLEWGRGITLLAGANGAGKTLLTRCLLGLEEGFGGSILFEGGPWSAELARRHIGYVIQDPLRHFLGLTCAEELTLGRRGVDPRPALGAVGLGRHADTPPVLLSGGEQRRLALASALAARPRYLILDEPFNALDWEGVRDTLRFLLRSVAEGVGVLLITHDLEKCLAHVDRVALLRAGRVVATGTVEEVWDRFPEAGVHPPAFGPQGWSACSWL